MSSNISSSSGVRRRRPSPSSASVLASRVWACVSIAELVGRSCQVRTYASYQSTSDRRRADSPLDNASWLSYSKELVIIRRSLSLQMFGQISTWFVEVENFAFFTRDKNREKFSSSLTEYPKKDKERVIYRNSKAYIRHQWIPLFEFGFEIFNHVLRGTTAHGSYDNLHLSAH